MLDLKSVEQAKIAAKPHFLEEAHETAQDWTNLASYLSKNGYLFEPENRPPKQFSGGFGNLNYLIELDGKPAVLRRPPMGKIPPGANDMKREHRILSKLCDAFPLAPRSLLYASNKNIIGNHFLIMEYRHGLTIGGEWPEFLAGRQDIGAKLGKMLVGTLVSFHSVDPADVSLDDFGRPQGFLERCIKGWQKRMELSSDDKLPSVGVSVAKWLESNIVPDGPSTLLHNDFKLDNILLNPDDFSPVAVLDWDQGTRGDPLFDLATLLSYWIEEGDPKAMRDVAQMPSAGNGFPTRSEVVNLYAEQSGRDVSNFLFYRVLAMFKLSIIFMQIYAQFRRGTSADDRFKRFGELTEGLMEFAHEISMGRAT